MPRKAKGIHSSPEKAGVKNMPKDFAEKNPDGLNTMEKILPMYNIGQKNRQDYKGLWTEEELEKAIREFFDYCSENDVKPAKVGLAMWLGMSKVTYWEWETKPEKYGFKSNLINQANSAIEFSYTNRVESFPTGNIFLLKALHNVVETNKLEITNTNPTTAEELLEAISKLGLDKE